VVENNPRGHSNSWYLNIAAANASLLISDVQKVDRDKLHQLGYVSRGYMNGAREFLVDPDSNKKKKRKKKQQKEGWMHTIQTPDGKSKGIDSPEWCYDNSFWNDQQLPMANYTFDEENFKAKILKVLGDNNSASLVSVEHFDSYKDLKTGREALGFRFKYHNPYYPLGKETALRLNEKVRMIISENFGELR